jgi:hypothetical protein
MSSGRMAENHEIITRYPCLSMAEKRAGKSFKDGIGCLPEQRKQRILKPGQYMGNVNKTAA